MDPQNHVEYVILNENNVFAYLESLGYDSSKLVKRNDNWPLFYYFIAVRTGFYEPLYKCAQKSTLFFTLRPPNVKNTS